MGCVIPADSGSQLSRTPVCSCVWASSQRQWMRRPGGQCLSALLWAGHELQTVHAVEQTAPMLVLGFEIAMNFSENYIYLFDIILCRCGEEVSCRRCTRWRRRLRCWRWALPARRRCGLATPRFPASAGRESWRPTILTTAQRPSSEPQHRRAVAHGFLRLARGRLAAAISHALWQHISVRDDKPLSSTSICNTSSFPCQE